MELGEEGVGLYVREVTCQEGVWLRDSAKS